MAARVEVVVAERVVVVAVWVVVLLEVRLGVRVVRVEVMW